MSADDKPPVDSEKVVKPDDYEKVVEPYTPSTDEVRNAILLSDADLAAMGHERPKSWSNAVTREGFDRMLESVRAEARAEADKELDEMIRDRDGWIERLDTLVYSLATVDEVGEWSSANDPDITVVDHIDGKIHRIEAERDALAAVIAAARARVETDRFEIEAGPVVSAVGVLQALSVDPVGVLAERDARMKAEAWDEGLLVGQDPYGFDATNNPYRARAEQEGNGNGD